MAHARQTIINTLVTKLTGLTTTGSNVFTWHPYSLQDDQLPAVMIMTDSETIVDESTTLPRKYLRELSVSISGYCSSTTSPLTTLNNISEEVEEVINADPTLGISIMDVRLVNTSFDTEQAGDYPIGRVTLEYVLMYRTDSTDSSNLST